ncbi:hypothetical protein CsSME_00049653 [Camellia sinensis var. sinensis]
MKIHASSSLNKNHHHDTLLTSDFALKILAELEAASRLRTAQFFVTQMPWLDLYGVYVRPVPPFGSASSTHLLIYTSILAG